MVIGHIKYLDSNSLYYGSPFDIEVTQSQGKGLNLNFQNTVSITLQNGGALKFHKKTYPKHIPTY